MSDYTAWLILGATAIVIIALAVIDARHHRRFDKIDRDHAKLHSDMSAQHRAQEEVLISTRNNSWYQFDAIKGHLMKLLRWDKKE